MEFVLIQPGSFMMGEAPGAAEQTDADERPRHRVAVTKPFLMSSREVTQAQFEAVTGRNPSHFKGADLPVEQVSWMEAVEFLAGLDELEGGRGQYRLPTEAEWEYAAREGWQGLFSFGDRLEDMGRYGWTAENSGNSTHPSGTLCPSGPGLFDIHGNVAEWTADWYSEGYYAQSPFQDPSGPGAGASKSVRGGGWGDSAFGCRSSYRGFMAPTDRNFYVGFRVVREPGRSAYKRMEIR
jgi:formylglycine-generating enzyme required for sulfatase activity